jgi:oligosaccharide repeat unit polymerase
MRQLAKPAVRKDMLSPLLQNLLLASFVLQIPLALWALMDSTGKGAMIWVGFACLAAIGFPLLLRGPRLNPLEPIVCCMVAVVIGATLRAPYVAFSENPKADFLRWEQDYWDIAGNGVWVIAALFCLSLGYMTMRGRIRFGTNGFITGRTVQLNGRFLFAALAAIVLALLAVAIFIQEFDVQLSLESLSRKRAISAPRSDGEEVFSALGHIRILAGFAEMALYFMVAYIFWSKRRLRPWHIVLALVLFASSALLPIITSSRMQVLIVIINCMAIGYLARRIKVAYVVPAVLLLGLIAMTMEDLRTIGSSGAEAEGTIVDTVVGSGNFFDLARTTALIDRVPDRVEHLYGSSYLGFFTAPVPRTIWPEKPMVSLGPWVRSEVFGLWTRNNGWPPNIVGEAHINFGKIGMLVICFIYGMFIRFVYNCFEEHLGKAIIPSVIYVVMFWPFNVQMFGLNFSQGLMTTLMAVVPAIVFIAVAAERTAPQRGRVLAHPMARPA